METPAFTTDNLTALNSAISEGVSVVQYSDKRIEYRTLNEMLTLRTLMMRELGLIKSNAGRRTLTFDKGVSDC